MKKINVLIIGLVLALLASPVFAIDGREVMQKAADVATPLYSHSLVRMDLIEKDGTTQSRTIEEWGTNKNDLTSVVMIFRSPASVKDTRFLQAENAKGGTDKWIYLPSLKSTRRVASSEGSKSFMGSDASYDDMSTREVDEDTHELMAESVEKNGFTCYQVKSTPVDADGSQYLYRISYIDHETNIPVSVEMYDKKGQLLKVLTVEQIRKVSKYDTPISNLLVNVQTGHSTRLVITNMEVDKPISSKVFTQNFLNTGKI
jgi:Protein of unknown function (DUF1329).